MIILKDVVKQYKNKYALRGINLHINPGEFVFLVGSSGAGKSTMMKMLYLEERPTLLDDRVSIRSGLGVVDGFETDLTFSIVLRGRDDIAGRIQQLEGELIRLQIASGQDLACRDLRVHRSNHIGVREGRVSTGDYIRHELALAIVIDLYGDHDRILVIGDTAGLSGNFTHLVFVDTGMSVSDRLEGDRAGSIVRSGRAGLAVRVGQDEAELAGSHLSSGQRLRRRQRHRYRLRLIRVREERFFGIAIAHFRGKDTLVIIHRDHHRISRGVVGVSGRISGHFADRISIRSGN